jgi:hypothetical protein
MPYPSKKSDRPILLVKEPYLFDYPPNVRYNDTREAIELEPGDEIGINLANYNTGISGRITLANHNIVLEEGKSYIVNATVSWEWIYEHRKSKSFLFTLKSWDSMNLSDL